MMNKREAVMALLGDDDGVNKELVEVIKRQNETLERMLELHQSMMDDVTNKMLVVLDKQARAMEGQYGLARERIRGVGKSHNSVTPGSTDSLDGEDEDERVEIPIESIIGKSYPSDSAGFVPPRRARS
jgi:hypothetical protein